MWPEGWDKKKSMSGWALDIKTQQQNKWGKKWGLVPLRLPLFSLAASTSSSVVLPLPFCFSKQKESETIIIGIHTKNVRDPSVHPSPDGPMIASTCPGVTYPDTFLRIRGASLKYLLLLLADISFCWGGGAAIKIKRCDDRLIE